MEFECKPSDKGVEATFVCGPSGTECRGSSRRPLSRKKFRKIRYILSLIEKLKKMFKLITKSDMCISSNIIKILILSFL